MRMDIPRGRNRPKYSIKEGDVIHDHWQVTSINKIEFFEIEAFQLTHL